jgi:long-chain-fatty-acid--CoA ligase ACSBG
MAKLYSTNPAERKEIVLGESGIAAAEPVTVIQLLRSTRDAHPQANALAYKDGDQWKMISYAEYDALCVKVAKSFLKLGLQKYHSVSIIGFNSPEWFLSALGAIYAGGLACGLYTSSSPEACQYIINDSKSVIVVVEDDRQLQKILKVKNDLPYLKAIIQYKGKVTENYPDVYEVCYDNYTNY